MTYDTQKRRKITVWDTRSRLVDTIMVCVWDRDVETIMDSLLCGYPELYTVEIETFA